MRYALLFVLLFASTGVFANACEWVVGHGGQYKGTDPVDGGLSYRTFLVEDNQCIMVGGDTWHGPCAYGVPAVLTSELTFSGNPDPWSNDGKLEGNWDLDCQAAPTDVSGDRFLAVRYTLDQGKGLLTEQLVDPVTGVNLGRPPIKFYRVSK